MPSLDSLLYAAVDGADLRDLVRRGGGVQRSDLVARVGRRLVIERLRPHDGSPVDVRAPLPQSRIESARAAVAAVSVDLRSAAHLAHRVNGEIVDLARARAVDVALRDLSEPVLGRVADYLCSNSAEPVSAWAQRMAYEVLDLVAGMPRKLSPVEFERSYRDYAYRAWCERGAHSLRLAPPSRVELGRDLPPALTPPRGSPENWLLGTDRSLYRRYTLHWTGRTQPRRGGRRPAGHREPPQVDHRGADLARLEIDRACQPWGLAHQAHRAAIDATFVGAGAPGASAGAWRAFRQRCHPAVDAAELAGAVADLVDGWARGTEKGAELERLIGDLATHVGSVQAAVTRKLWMDLLRREREADQPACSCLLARYLRVAVAQGIPEALRQWVAGPLRSQPTPDDAAPMDHLVETVDSDSSDEQRRRLDATYDLLGRHHVEAEQMFALAPGWEDVYRHLVARATDVDAGEDGDYLTVDEMRAEIIRHRSRFERRDSCR